MVSFVSRHGLLVGMPNSIGSKFLDMKVVNGSKPNQTLSCTKPRGGFSEESLVRPWLSGNIGTAPEVLNALTNSLGGLKFITWLHSPWLLGCDLC